MASARIGDIGIHYDVTDFTDPWRSSETVLLHHGFARNMEFWRPWVPLLARDYRVVRFDARGYGKTTVPPPGAPYTLELMVRDALGLMDFLGMERLHWCGEASGGIVGLAVALAHPQRIASLTLCNTPFRLTKMSLDQFVPEEVEKYGLGYWARKTLHNRINVDKVSSEWVEWSIAEHDKVPRHIAIAHHKVLEQGDLFPHLHKVSVPVFAMAGSSGKIAPLEQIRQMQQQLPHMKLSLFEGYGQGIAFMVPERCVAEMRAFLEGLKAVVA